MAQQGSAAQREKLGDEIGEEGASIVENFWYAEVSSLATTRGIKDLLGAQLIWK